MSDVVASPAGARKEAALTDVVRWLSQHWFKLGICACVGAVTTFLVVRQMPKQYTATVTILPASSGQSNSAAGAIAGIASLAGIATTRGMDQSEIGLALLQSRKFSDAFIAENRLFDDLLEERVPRAAPTAVEREQAFKRFSGILAVKRGVGTDQLTRVQVTWKDPELAASWANNLVNRVNAEMRRRSIASTQQRKSYLESELSRNQNAELRLAIADMIASELKSLMAARQPSGFAFEVLDPAVPPVKPSGPRIVVLTAAGAIVGLLCGFLWAALTTIRRRG